MTCIVGIVEGGKVYLGGDRAAVEDRHYFSTVSEPKVFAVGPFVMGFTTSFRMGQILRYRFTPPALPPSNGELHRYMATEFVDALRACLKDNGWLKTHDGRDDGGVFLVGVSGHLFAVDNDFNVLSRVNGFDACGSGVSVALGALFASANADPEDRCRTALLAASEFVSSVRAPFDVVSANS